MMRIVPEKLKEEVRIITKEKESNLNRLREIKNTIGRNSWDISVQLLKEELRTTGRGMVNYVALSKAYADKNYKALMSLLEELFLDVVSDVDIDVMYSYITGENKLKELYMSAEHNNRFMASVMEI